MSKITELWQKTSPKVQNIIIGVAIAVGFFAFIGIITLLGAG